MMIKYFLIALLLCISLCLSAQINGALNQIGDKTILHVWGDHYQRGYAQGYLLTPQIMQVFDEFYWTMFCFSNLPFYSQLTTYYHEHFGFDQRMFNEALGMAQGMAASGQSIYHNGLARNLATDDLLLLNTVFDMVAVRESQINDGLELGCASLSSWGAATAADSLLASSSVITRLFDASQNSALIGNPLMVVHHPSESDEHKWLGLSFPGFFSPITAISEDGVFASMNIGSDHNAPNPSNLSPILFDLRRGIERIDYDSSGSNHPLDLLASVSAGNHLSGSIVHTLGEAGGTVYSSVIETRNGATVNRLYNQNGSLPTHHLAATNHFRLLASPVCCNRYANIQDSLYANSHVSAKRQWQVLAGAAGLETTLSAIQFVPSTGALLWASASLSEPAYSRPALSLLISDLFSYAVANDDEYIVPSPFRLSIYPNPLMAGNQVKISSSEPLTAVEIFNLKGQKLMTSQLAGKSGEALLQIDTRDFPSGIYLLKSTSSSAKTQVKKFIVF